MKMLESTDAIERLIEEVFMRFPDHHSMIALAKQAKSELSVQQNTAITRANEQ